MNRLAIFALIFLTACKPKPSEQVFVDPALEMLVPADAVLLAGVRLEKLMQTPLYTQTFGDRQLPQIEDFAQRTGLDPRKDLWDLLYVSNGKRGFLLGRGKFADEMEPRLEKQGGTRTSYKGFNLVGNENAAVVLISPTVAAVGSSDALHYLIDQRDKSSGPAPSMRTLVREIPPAAQLWAAYTGGPIKLPFDARSDLANINKVLQSIQTGTIYADLRNGFNTVGTATCATDEAAQQLQGAFKAFAGLGRLSVPKDQPELAQVYDGIRVTQEGHQVKLYLDVPQQMVGKILGTWMGGRGNARPVLPN